MLSFSVGKSCTAVKHIRSNVWVVMAEHKVPFPDYINTTLSSHVSQPISRQQVADSSRHGQDGDAHYHGPSSQHYLPVHRPRRQPVWPERPEPHLWAGQNTRSVHTQIKQQFMSAAVTNTSVQHSKEKCVFLPQMWVLQVRVWTTGRCKGSWERWPSSFKIPSPWQHLPSVCPGMWVTFRKQREI